jgi:putative ABC transport system substrate-binding protein
MSAFGGKAENICSHGAFPVLTHKRHRRIPWMDDAYPPFQRTRLNATMPPVEAGGLVMRRRDFVAGALSFAAATRVAAQPVANSRRLAIVSISGSHPQMRDDSGNYMAVFLAELRRLGQIEGQNLTIERYGKEQYQSDATALAAQVVRSNPDVIYVIDPGATYFQHETSKIPIVTITNDPVGLGFAQSLAHPGGNITGVAAEPDASIHGKRIALLREMFPAMSKLVCIAARRAWERSSGAPVRAAADAAGVSLVSVLIDLPGNATIYRNAIAQAARDGADAIMMLDSPDALANRAVISEAIAEARIPAIHAFVEAVDAGGLMAYSFDLKELIKRMAGNVDAILRGANPAEIPFYQVSKFELSINLKAAKALGLSVPATLLATANKVVE